MTTIERFNWLSAGVVVTLFLETHCAALNKGVVRQAQERRSGAQQIHLLASDQLLFPIAI
jgi:hypothetical protein